MRLRKWQRACIQKALARYRAGHSHFLCLATPGAGKTLMAARLAQQLFKDNLIDLVLCFSPSVIVAKDFGDELEKQLERRCDGSLRAAGNSLTYQAMLSLGPAFWDLFKQYRVLVIFDEIHHCAGRDMSRANAWGQQIISKIQGHAAHTLALTGTPWRSDKIPIVLAQYCNQKHQIQCDYRYGIKEAIADNVCRIPRLVLIDNDNIVLKKGDETSEFSSFTELLTQSEFSYQNLIQSETLLKHVLTKANKKLNELRRSIPDAGGLIIASSVSHAQLIYRLLEQTTGECAVIATYQQDDAPKLIEQFKYGRQKWLIAVGMVSEGTNIPRLRVCCHLTRVKTELHFRQVLGRILRSTGVFGEEGFLYMPAEPTLIEFSTRIGTDIPAENVVMIDVDSGIGLDAVPENEDIPVYLGDDIVSGKPEDDDEGWELSDASPASVSLLEQTYASTLNIFGKFREDFMTLSGVHSGKP